MQARGSLAVDGRASSVTGLAWLDREFGECDFCPQMGGWDWFGIQLDDGREVMVYQVCDQHRWYNGHRSLSVIDGHGRIRQLRPEDFTMHAVGTWTSPRTGTVYPRSWNLDVPKLNMRLRIEPSLDCQELDTRGSTNVVYWEGAADVSGQDGNGPLAGQAYAELVGYHDPDRRITQKFIGWWDLFRNEVRYWQCATGLAVQSP